MGGIVDDFRHCSLNPARGAAYLAPAQSGGSAYSDRKLLYRLVSLFRRATQAEPGACTNRARADENPMMLQRFKFFPL